MHSALQRSRVGHNKKWTSKLLLLGNIHVLRKHKGEREGVSQMLTIDDKGGGRGGKNPKNLLT